MKLKKILNLLNKNEKKKGFFLILLVLLMATMDVMGVASILPFIAVLSNPQTVETNFLLVFLYDKSRLFGVSDINEFLFFSWDWGIYFFDFITLTKSTYKLFSNSFYNDVGV